MTIKSVLCVTVTLIAVLSGLPALAQNVKITPLGSHDGELCPFDRALIFEDPDGTPSCTTPAVRCAVAATPGWTGSTPSC